MDVAVIGAGIAGLTAGLYAARAGAEVAIFEQLAPGGLAMNILKLENYPGFVDGVSGMELIDAATRQAEAVGCTFIYESVVELVPPAAAGDKFTLRTSEAKYTASAVIVACGSAPRRLGLEREQELTGRGVSYCATCDGALFRGKDVAVVGGDNTALTDALVLSGLVNRVHLIHRRKQMGGTEILRDRVQAAENIELHLEYSVTELLGDTVLSGLRLEPFTGGEATELPVAGVFIAVGYAPQSSFVHGVAKLDERGVIITDSNLETSCPGLFAAGDCRDTVLRQVVTSAADGAVSGTKAAAYARQKK